MSYQVIARKWRPQSFEEIVGQPHVTRTLKNAIERQRVAHAFLFSGVRGVGKTTMARILAKALNCRQGPTITPCGSCSSCTEISAGNSIDVQEIDAASNTGVDSIRELRENTRYAPARDRFKIFIIDEVHMLSNASFNALLKTLEEPPAHVKFIMATTELHKIPATILSRVQQFDFKTIPLQIIIDRLRLICQQEGIQASDFALATVARSAQGSMRDAQSALDQVVAFSGREVADRDIETILGLVGDGILNELALLLHGRDAAGVLQWVHRAASSGIDLTHLVQQVEEHFRNLLVWKTAGAVRELFVLSDEQMGEVERQSEWFNEIELLRIADLLAAVRGDLRWSPHARFTLELGLLKLCHLAGLAPLEDLLRRLSESPGAAMPAVTRPISAAEPQRDRARAAESVRPAPVPDPECADPAANHPDAVQSPPLSSLRTDRPEARPTPYSEDDFVHQLLEQVHAEKATLASFLENAASITREGDVLVVRFSSQQKFHRDFLEKPENQQALRRICATMTGSDMQLRIGSVDESAGAPTAAQPEILDDPVVKTFLEKFPGKISVERFK
ncbi:MAG: DNA polymerase III subunit gamma/tau [Acidobacteriota bacterium]